MLDRIKAHFFRKLIEPASSFLRGSRVQVSGDSFRPGESSIDTVELAGKLLRGGDGRLPLERFGRSSRWELPLIEIVQFPVWIVNLFVHLYSSKRIDEPSIARGQHCAPGDF